MKRVSMLISSVLWTMIALMLLIPGIDIPRANVRAETQDMSAQPETLIVLHVTGPDGEDARATVIDGGAFSIKDQNTGEQAVFVPSLSTTNRHNVVVKVYKGASLKKSQSDYPRQAMSIERSEESEMPLGSSKYSLLGNSYNVEIEAIIKRFTNRQAKLPEIVMAQKPGRFIILLPEDCCVSCNGKLYCSNCSVETACGCCHSNGCSC